MENNVGIGESSNFSRGFENAIHGLNSLHPPSMLIDFAARQYKRLNALATLPYLKDPNFDNRFQEVYNPSVSLDEIIDLIGSKDDPDVGHDLVDRGQRLHVILKRDNEVISINAKTIRIISTKLDDPDNLSEANPVNFNLPQLGSLGITWMARHKGETDMRNFSKMFQGRKQLGKLAVPSRVCSLIEAYLTEATGGESESLNMLSGFSDYYKKNYSANEGGDAKSRTNRSNLRDFLFKMRLLDQNESGNRRKISPLGASFVEEVILPYLTSLMGSGKDMESLRSNIKVILFPNNENEISLGISTLKNAIRQMNPELLLHRPDIGLYTEDARKKIFLAAEELGMDRDMIALGMISNSIINDDIKAFAVVDVDNFDPRAGAEAGRRINGRVRWQIQEFRGILPPDIKERMLRLELTLRKDYNFNERDSYKAARQEWENFRNWFSQQVIQDKELLSTHVFYEANKDRLIRQAGLDQTS